VFPFEWLTIQNIINLKTTNLSLTAKQEIFKAYKIWYDHEIKQRAEMEEKLKALAAKVPIVGFQPTHLMANRDQIAEDAH